MCHLAKKCLLNSNFLLNLVTLIDMCRWKRETAVQIALVQVAQVDFWKSCLHTIQVFSDSHVKQTPKRNLINYNRIEFFENVTCKFVVLQCCGRAASAGGRVSLGRCASPRSPTRILPPRKAKLNSLPPRTETKQSKSIKQYPFN